MNRSNIQEANRHLQALYDRIDELEKVVQQQHDLIVTKDSFVQIKIRELSEQDRDIHDLQNELSRKDEVINQSKLTVGSLKKDISSKSSEINALKSENSVLREKNRLLCSVLQLAPDLSKVLAHVEGVSKQIEQIGTDGYVEVNGEVADGGDRTSTLLTVTKNISDTKTNIQNSEENEHSETIPSVDSEYSTISEVGEDRTVTNGDENINNSSSIKFPHTDEMYNQSVGDMARTFLRTGISSQFSVSEDDVGDEPENIPQGQPNKEVYF